jgi:twitching motility protein PilT
MRQVEGAPLKAEELRAFVESIAPKGVAADLDRAFGDGAVFSAEVGEAGRFRCSLYSHLGGPGVVLKTIPATIRGIEALQLPAIVRHMTLESAGLVIVAGPGGSGRTTTLAAMVDLINESTSQKIVTIESPVEYLHGRKKGLVTQMEVGQNVASMEHGLELALQQDADVIAVGDLSDASVAGMILSAAESGKKILAVMTAPSAIAAVSRLAALGSAGGRGGDSVTAQIAATLEGVIVQRLARTRDGQLRAAVEIMRGGANTSKAIREGRFKDVSYFIEGRQAGMQSLDQHLVELQQAGIISGTEALRLAVNTEAVGEKLRAR